MSFRVGQKVVCVDDSPDFMGVSWLVKGAEYTIDAVKFCENARISQSRTGSGLGVKVVEVATGQRDWFFAHRFRPLIERKTDITVFTEILRKATKRKPATV